MLNDYKRYVLVVYVILVIRSGVIDALPIDDELTDIRDNLEKCQSVCDKDESCIAGCKMTENRKHEFLQNPSEDEMKLWCSQSCKDFSDSNKCETGCINSLSEINGNQNGLPNGLIKIRVFQVPSAENDHIKNHILNIHSLLNHLFKFDKLKNNGHGSNAIDSANSEVLNPSNAVENKKPMCGKMLAFKQWKAMQDAGLSDLTNGALEIWLFASLLILMSTTLWLMIWLKQIRKRRSHSSNERVQGADHIEKDESLPEYSAIVERV